jgi:putative phosphonate metabolism protein
MPERNGSTSRYGIYFAPARGVSLHELGSRWLGRDAATGESLDPELPANLAHDFWCRATLSPRRYGFHATLKPPFRLAEGVCFEDLQSALHEFAAARSAFHAPALAVNKLGRFLALTLSETSEPFENLAADCVSEFDSFRAPATDEELAQRLQAKLTLREREHVHRWGYPYVFDTWKFHMSLTGSLSSEDLPPLEEHLRERFRPAECKPLPINSICIFHETHPGAPFRIVDRATLRTL